MPLLAPLVAANPTRRRLLGGGCRLAAGLALAPVLVRPRTAQALTPDADSLRTPLDALIARTVAADAPGLVVLVARGEQRLYRGARGMASLELSVPLAPEHVLRIASVTKQYAAAALLQLVDQGRARLDDPLAKYLPAYPNGAAITLAQLLNHSSGVKSYTQLSGYMRNPVRRDLSTAELIAEFSGQPADFAPGEGWAYNNSGYVLVGAVIEAITQQPWHAQVATMLRPLGLMRTVYEDPTRVIPGLVSGYGSRRDEPGSVARAGLVSMTQPHAAGALVSTADELWQWNLALHRGAVLQPPTYRRMCTPEGAHAQKEGYGFGIRRETMHGRTVLMHGGGIHGFKSVLMWFPEESLSVVALHNSDSAQLHVGRFGAAVAALALGATPATGR